MRGTLLSVLVWCALVTGPLRAAEWPFAHVRSDEPAFRAVIAEGYQRSATFRALVDELDSRPGIVYIASIPKLSQDMEGALLHTVAGSPSLPVLRVLLRGYPVGDYAIALVAHELQHVAEVLRGEAASSPDAMTRFFASLDVAHDGGVSKSETEAARQVAERVLRELRHRFPGSNLVSEQRRFGGPATRLVTNISETFTSFSTLSGSAYISIYSSPACPALAAAFGHNNSGTTWTATRQ